MENTKGARSNRNGQRSHLVRQCAELHRGGPVRSFSQNRNLSTFLRRAPMPQSAAAGEHIYHLMGDARPSRITEKYAERTPNATPENKLGAEQSTKTHGGRCHKQCAAGIPSPTSPNQQGHVSTAPSRKKKAKKSAERDPGNWGKGVTKSTINAWANKSSCQATSRTSPGLPRASHLANS